MKAKVFLVAALSLMSLLWVGCEPKDEATSKSPLAGTIWRGALQAINIEIDYLEDNTCYIRLTGGVIATAQGTYKTTKSTVYMTITNLTGDFGGNLHKGDVLSATFDLQEETMVFYMPIDGAPRSIELIQY